MLSVARVISSLRKVSSKCFSDLEIRLDGYQYIDCAFHNCCFVYSGRRRFNLVGNLISSDCVLQLRGRAADTVSALRNLHELGDWGRNCVAETLRQIECKKGGAGLS
jgi:hypothetical protein